MIIVKAGEPIYLNLQMGSGETGKYPQAILKEADGTELPQSPVDLDDVGDGLYTSSEVSMPSYPIVIASYKVYVDAGHSELSDDYDAINVYVLDTQNVPSFEDELVGVLIDEQAITGYIEDEDTFFGMCQDDDAVEGLYIPDDTIIGTFNDISLYEGRIED